MVVGLSRINRKERTNEDGLPNPLSALEAGGRVDVGGVGGNVQLVACALSQLSEANGVAGSSSCDPIQITPPRSMMVSSGMDQVTSSI